MSAWICLQCLQELGELRRCLMINAHAHSRVQFTQ